MQQFLAFPGAAIRSECRLRIPATQTVLRHAKCTGMPLTTGSPLLHRETAFQVTLHWRNAVLWACGGL